MHMSLDNCPLNTKYSRCIVFKAKQVDEAWLNHYIHTGEDVENKTKWIKDNPAKNSQWIEDTR